MFDFDLNLIYKIYKKNTVNIYYEKNFRYKLDIKKVFTLNLFSISLELAYTSDTDSNLIRMLSLV